MHSSAPSPTKDEARRMQRLPYIGCVACMQKKMSVLCQVQHLLSGGRRRGHRYTVALCPWHHQGIPPGPLTMKQAEKLFGPSFELHKRRFHEAFGSNDELLAKTDELLTKAEQNVVGAA